eukprot:2841124-Pyramimonas_sp.AAC.1
MGAFNTGPWCLPSILSFVRSSCVHESRRIGRRQSCVYESRRIERRQRRWRHRPRRSQPPEGPALTVEGSRGRSGCQRGRKGRRCGW